MLYKTHKEIKEITVILKSMTINCHLKPSLFILSKNKRIKCELYHRNSKKTNQK